MEDLYTDELYEDEEEEALEGEGTNRTFIILVGGLGGLLALSICIFAVWAFVINPRMRSDRLAQNESVQLTNEAIMAASGMITDTVSAQDVATETPLPVETEAPEPTATVPPTNTPRPTATPEPPTPTLEEGEATVTPAQVAEAPASSKATATPVPASSKQGVPETGVGALGIGALAVGLLFLLVVVRRVRRTA